MRSRESRCGERFWGTRSRTAISRLGAKQDAVLRNHQISPDGSYRDTVVFSTIKGRLKTRNMARDPRVSLLVVDKGQNRYLEIRGRVEITDDPEKRLLYEMYDRYMDGIAPPPEPDAERLIVRITPQKVYQFPPVAA